jgi:hypothetical protein
MSPASTVTPRWISASSANSLGPEAPRERERRRIVGVDHGPVVGGLAMEHARLGGAVGLERAVPVEVIRREIQQDGDPRVECLRRFELKAADLDDMKRLGARVLDLRRQRRAEVAACRDVEAALAQHPCGERRRRRLALRSRDRNHAPREPARCQLDLSHDRHTGRASGHDRGMVGWHAWTRDDEIGTGEERGRMRTELDGDAQAFEVRPPIERAGGVAQRHARAARHEQLRNGDAAPAAARDDHPLSRHAEAHRITSASTS